MTVQERLKEYISSKGLSVRKFEITCGFANGWVSDLTSAIKFDNVSEIYRNFPDLNIDWLFTGEGSMLRETPAPPSSSPAVKVDNIQTVFIGNWGELKAVMRDAIKETLKK